MGAFYDFDRMVTPVLIQIAFVAALVLVAGAGVVLSFTATPLVGLPVMVLGGLAVRVQAELLILGFRIHSTLQEIAEELSEMNERAGSQVRQSLDLMPIAASPLQLDD